MYQNIHLLVHCKACWLILLISRIVLVRFVLLIILWLSKFKFIISIESGRYVPNQKGWMERTYISDGDTIGTIGQVVAMYRIKNKAIESKNIGDVSYVLFFFYFIKDLGYRTIKKE